MESNVGMSSGGPLIGPMPHSPLVYFLFCILVVFIYILVTFFIPLSNDLDFFVYSHNGDLEFGRNRSNVSQLQTKS